MSCLMASLLLVIAFPSVLFYLHQAGRQVVAEKPPVPRTRAHRTNSFSRQFLTANRRCPETSISLHVTVTLLLHRIYLPVTY